ncbi:MAG: molybdopterin-dependent oxidoreductase [Anaerolineales bacterium]|jgi:hypothetical protein
MSFTKRFIPVVLLVLLVTACSSSSAPASTQLAVTGDQPEKSFTVEQLQAMPVATASYNGVDYTGVALQVLLEQAGYDPAAVDAVQAIASDGYSVKYDRDLVMLDNTIVAYGQGDTPLSSDDGTFRMVLPDQEGKMNVRMLSELHVNP